MSNADGLGCQLHTHTDLCCLLIFKSLISVLVLMTWNTKFSHSGSVLVHSLSSGTAHGRAGGFLGASIVPSDPRSSSPELGQGASAVGLT